MPNQQPINEHELEKLLRDMFLDRNSNSTDAPDANFVFSQDYQAPIDPTRERELLSRLNPKTGGLGKTGVIAGVLVIMTLLGILGTYIFSKHQNSPVQHAEKGKPVSATFTEEGSNLSMPPASGTEIQAKIPDTFDHQHPLAVTMPAHDTVVPDVPKEIARKKEPLEKAIPVLTEKDRLRYKGIKEQMIVAIVKFDKNLYTKIPAYKTVHAGEPVILDGFAIRNVGITNLEYKAFLADLLAHNRKDDYLICDVRTANWDTHGCRVLAGSYFQEKAYNDFPVVNISYDAAKLFCKWLEEETASYIRQNNRKLKAVLIRLPYDEEWVFAAREGYVKIAFEQGYNTIYDESAGLVNKSFTNRVELVKKHAERVDTLYPYYATNRYGWSEREISSFFETGMGYYRNLPPDTIMPKRMQVLGKFGHVSEMVPQKNNNKLWLSGLSWKSKDEYKNLEQEFKSRGSSPFVGFRIVVVNPNDPEYKNPFW